MSRISATIKEAFRKGRSLFPRQYIGISPIKNAYNIKAGIIKEVR